MRVKDEAMTRRNADDKGKTGQSRPEWRRPMTYRSIVTFLRDASRDESSLMTAAGIVAANDGHLSAICVGLDPIQPGIYYSGVNAVAIQQGLEEAQADADATQKAARALLGRQAISWETVALAVQSGALGHLAASRAQFADLVVVPKPYGEGRGPADVAILEAALFGTRAPVLVVPPGPAGGPLKADRIMVGWNQSPEALAAVRAALPLLSRAQSVDIAIIDPPSHGPDRSDPGGLLAEMLARHGVRADISVLARTLPRVSDVMCRHCADIDADLVVMGAYGHSRLREAILGGATRNMLEACEKPVLMAH
jgi:nucleotide-binding universal stress UspA family protein